VKTQIASDRFATHYVVWVALALIAITTYETVLDTYGVGSGLMLFAAFVVWSGYFINRLHLKRWREAVSVAIALPVCLVLGLVLRGIGIDGAQFSFWLTYSYYEPQRTDVAFNKFKWAEDGVFLGGGWANHLVYDPADNVWVSAPGVTTADSLGLGQKESKVDGVDCDFYTVKKLGGHWYFTQDLYAMDSCD
jgi:hypothetical protein